jgi:RimJ/RimL family protein N-acetyltransferase
MSTKVGREITLIDVEHRIHSIVLYEQLRRRPGIASISHKTMPAYEDHYKFLASNPYEHWWLIEYQDKWIGNLYLTRHHEIGIFIDDKFQNRGLGSRLIRWLKTQYKDLKANVAPMNITSQYLFVKHGFKLVQHTYIQK